MAKLSRTGINPCPLWLLSSSIRSRTINKADRLPPGSGGAAWLVLLRADRALFKGKDSGRDCICIDGYDLAVAPNLTAIN